MEYLKSNDIYFESWDGNEHQYNIRPHDNALQIYLTDPEGNWIEVNQRPVSYTHLTLPTKA